ncbi:helix-turn-helix transcriptional regulator [Roseateles flavus]|uniref:AlpA family phage regulatory protein n=1 Tax=Roseateles flavus TaxID=3149041 RepID=A0ABV0GKZ2_9BURK
MPTTTLLPANAPACVVSPIPTSLPDIGFVREARLLLFLPFSHSTLWRRVAARTFPAPVKLSQRVTAWKVEDVRAWIAAQGDVAAVP